MLLASLVESRDKKYTTKRLRISIYNKLDVAYTKNSIVLKRRVEGFNFLLGVLTLEQSPSAVTGQRR